MNSRFVISDEELDEALATAMVTKFQKYSEDQPRDDHGRWTDGGGGDGGGSSQGGPGGSGGSASELFAQYTDHTATADSIIASYPGAKEALDAVNDKLKFGVATDKPVSQGGFKNPDGTYTPERELAHQQIINNYLTQANVDAASPAEGEKPTMTILGGRGGSGKSFLTSGQGPVQGDGIDEANHMVGNALYLNSDDIKAMLPGYQGWNAPLLHEEASHVFDQISDQAQALGINIVHDSTMKDTGKALVRLQGYQQAGYNLEGHYMFAPPQQAATQALGRYMRGTAKLPAEARTAGVTGRMVSPGYILGSVTNEASFDAAKPMFSKWTIYSNTSGKPTLYAKGEK